MTTPSPRLMALTLSLLLAACGGDEGGAADEADAALDARPDGGADALVDAAPAPDGCAPLAVISTTPAHGAVDVPEATTRLTLEFNQPVVPGSMEGDVDPANHDFTLTWGAGDTRLLLDFPYGLETDVTYTIEIFSLTSACGSLLDDQLCFSTGPTLRCRARAECLPPDATDGIVPAYREVDYEGVFSPTSPFNLPIPDAPEIHEDNAAMLAGLEGVLEATGGVWLGAIESTVPIYITGAATPRVDVTLTASNQGIDLLPGVPIPEGAITDCGPDRFFVTYDPEAERFYELYRAEQGADGAWVAQTGNHTSMGGEGIYPGDGARASDGVRASGFSLAAGLIWPHELEAGRIEHALVMGYSQVRAGGPLSPATASDGQHDSARAIPMGARLQLDPSIDLDALDLAPHERTIARALQVYGAFIGDTAGGVALSLVNPYAFEGDPYAALLPPSAAADGGLYLTRFSAADFRLLRP